MSKAFAFFLLLIFSIVTFYVGLHVGRADMKTQYAARIDGLHAQTLALAKKYSTLAKIINCESGGRHDDIFGDGGAAYGIAQFHRATFKEMAGFAGCENCRYTDRADQLKLLSWAYDHDRLGAWSCYEGD